jgi:putative protein-disulfide isomerase
MGQGAGGTLIYGFDPLCGWCYGIVPAMRALRAARPGLSVRLVMSGLVTGSRVGPYAEMEGYIRGASDRLRQVTGRAPSEAFFDLIRRPGVRGDSAPPSVAIAAAGAANPGREVDFAHAVIEAHFEAGADLNDPATYPPLCDRLGLSWPAPDLADPALAEAAWAEGRAMGLSSFPTLAVLSPAGGRVLPSTYDPAALVAQVDAALAQAA